MTTYYVDGAVGDNANAGTSEGAGNAWATIDYAMNQVAAGDDVYVKASVTYNEQATIVTAGTSISYIRFFGYSSTPGDNGRVTIDGQSTRTHAIGCNVSTSIYYCFFNFRFTGATQDGIIGNLSADFVILFNCRLDNNASYGWQMDNWGLALHCQFDNNGNGGFDNDSNMRFAFCEIFANGAQNTASSAQYVFCLSYEAGATYSPYPSPSTMILNLADGEGNNVDLSLSQNTGGFVIGNIMHDTAADAFGNTIPKQTTTPWLYNYFSNITGSNYQDATDYDGTLGYGDVTDNTPAFTDEAGNDYTPTASSPYKDMIAGPGLIN